MRTLSLFVLIAAMFAIVIAYPASELEDNNQALYDVNVEGVEHDSAPRETRQFGFGRYGGFGGGGFGRYGGFGGGFGRYGGYGGFGGYRGFGGFGGFGGGYGGYYG